MHNAVCHFVAPHYPNEDTGLHKKACDVTGSPVQCFVCGHTLVKVSQERKYSGMTRFINRVSYFIDCHDQSASLPGNGRRPYTTSQVDQRTVLCKVGGQYPLNRSISTNRIQTRFPLDRVLYTAYSPPPPGRTGAR